MGYYTSYIIMIPAILIAMWASFNVKSTYKKYSKVINSRGLTGAQVARQILDMNGLNNVRVEHIAGDLTDHFDPRANVVRLSDTVYNNPSVAAVGVAAHECGHAVQYQHDYFPMKIRAAIIPATNFGSRLAVPLVIIGILIAAWSGASEVSETIINIGLILYSLVVFFQLITLPVEFDASRRGKRELKELSILNDQEQGGSSTMLRAAAFTYVAGLITGLIEILRLIIIFNNRRD